MTPKDYHRKIEGLTIDLAPLSDAHTPAVVRLRNSPHIRAFFDEKDETTAESQTRFLRAYEQKADDLYWAVCLKDGTVIGTNRLNEIEGVSGTKGSQTIDADYARTGPYALEAELLLLDFGFDVLGLQTIKAAIRADNEKVISMNLKLGFTKESEREIRGVIYDVYKLDRKDYAPAPLKELVAYFAARSKKS